MKKQIARCLIVAATLIQLCAPDALAGGGNSIVVSGRVVNIPENGSRTIIINECDISDKDVRRVAELDSAGGFCERIPLSYGHTFTVNYNRSLFINMYAEPGDSVDILLDASKSPMEFHVSGDRAKLNEELSHVHQDMMPLLYTVSLLPDTAALDNYLAQFRHEVDRICGEADQYFALHSVSDEVADLTRRDLIFCVANQAIGFRGHSREEREAFFTDSIFNLSDPDNARVMIFPYHLSALMRNYPQYIDSVPKGIVRDLMYVTGFKRKGASERPDRSEFSNVAYYDRVFGDTDVAPVLTTTDMPVGDVLVYRGDSISALKNVDIMAWIAKEYPGRGVYLDISATWCGPCRGSLSHSEGVREHFKDSDIVFVVLWLKSEKDEWVKLAPTIHNAVQFFVESEDMNNLLMGRLKVGAFPSTRFITPDGNILYEGIPEFHSNVLPDFLKSHSSGSH